MSWTSWPISVRRSRRPLPASFIPNVDLRARSFLKERCREAGLRLREDALGNLFARWNGSSPKLPAVGTGSHIDAIPHSGRYDGTVGVLGGLETLRALHSAGFQPRRSLELLLFTSEEPTRFGLGCLGSRAMSGSTSPAALAHLQDNESRSLDQVRESTALRATWQLSG